MSGTSTGSKKSVITTRERYGEDWYQEIGSVGGRKGKKDGVIKGFAAMTPEKRAKAGSLGGRNSSRKDIKSGDGVSRSTLYKLYGTTAVGPLRIEKPKWWQFIYRRQLKRLGVH